MTEMAPHAEAACHPMISEVDGCSPESWGPDPNMQDWVEVVRVPGAPILAHGTRQGQHGLDLDVQAKLWGVRSNLAQGTKRLSTTGLRVTCTFTVSSISACREQNKTPHPFMSPCVPGGGSLLKRSQAKIRRTRVLQQLWHSWNSRLI